MIKWRELKDEDIVLDSCDDRFLLLDAVDSGYSIDNVVELNITEVEPMLNQPRKIFDKDKLQEHIMRSSKSYRGRIQSINLKTNEIKIYETISQAQNETGIDRHTIRNRIRKNIIKDDIKWIELEK